MTHYESSDWGELYDLREDPEERNNLWDDPSAAADRLWAAAEENRARTNGTLARRDMGAAPTAGLGAPRERGLSP